MRKLILFGGSLFSVLLAAGCATPAYSAAERSQMIQRNIDFNGGQTIDDFDSFFLLRPASHMSIWDVQ